MKIINYHALQSVILYVMPFSIIFISGCVAPLENLYEPGVETHLITLTYEGQRPRVTSSGSSIIPEIIYKVNRPVKDFVNRLQPKGNIVCEMELYHIVGGKTGYLDSLREPILVFDIESLDETGVLKPIFFRYSSDMKKILIESSVRDWPLAGLSNPGGESLNECRSCRFTGAHDPKIQTHFSAQNRSFLTSFVDQEGKKHIGRVSNRLVFPTSFVL